MAVSREQGEWIERRGFCDAAKIKVIQPCVDLSSYLRVPKKRLDKKIKIGAIGRLDQQKGFDILVEGFAAAKREDLELHIYGDGPENEMLRNLAKDTPNIIFHGFSHDTSSAVADCDFIAMPSRWEPYGLVSLEAMAAQRPVLTSRTDGLGSHVRVGAFDIGENSVSGWSTALRSLDPANLMIRRSSCRTHAALAPDRFSHAWNTLIQDLACEQYDMAIAA